MRATKSETPRARIFKRPGVAHLQRVAVRVGIAIVVHKPTSLVDVSERAVPPPDLRQIVELVLVAPQDRGLADWLGLPREVSSTLSAGAVDLPDDLLGKGGAPITTTYHLYAVDKYDANHNFDLKAGQHQMEAEKPKKPKWMDWRRRR